MRVRDTYDPQDYTYTTRFELDEGVFTGTAAEFPYLLVEGDTKEEALKSIMRAVEEEQAKGIDPQPNGHDHYPTQFTVVAYRENWERRCSRSCNCLHDSEDSQFQVKQVASFQELLCYLEFLKEDDLTDRGPYPWDILIFAGGPLDPTFLTKLFERSES